MLRHGAPGRAAGHARASPASPDSTGPVAGMSAAPGRRPGSWGPWAAARRLARRGGRGQRGAGGENEKKDLRLAVSGHGLPAPRVGILVRRAVLVRAAGARRAAGASDGIARSDVSAIRDLDVVSGAASSMASRMAASGGEKPASMHLVDGLERPRGARREGAASSPWAPRGLARRSAGLAAAAHQAVLLQVIEQAGDSRRIGADGHRKLAGARARSGGSTAAAPPPVARAGRPGSEIAIQRRAQVAGNLQAGRPDGGQAAGPRPRPANPSAW